MATILIVEDDDDTRSGIALGLKNSGHAILQARDGGEGLEMLSKYSVDLMVLDIMMPEISGLGVLDIVQKKYPDVKVIIVSAIAQSQKGKDAFKDIGASVYLEKPLKLVTLQNEVRRLVG
jgi:DNA-binding response OmpR family regulator